VLFDFHACTLLSAEERERLADCYASRLTRDGRLQVTSQRARSQADNRAFAENRLVELITAALHVPTTRRPTRPTRSSQRYRVAAKKQRGEIKRQRRTRPSAND
jgi:ribosome-associated protein